jgi:hypothetical protein
LEAEEARKRENLKDGFCSLFYAAFVVSKEREGKKVKAIRPKVSVTLSNQIDLGEEEIKIFNETSIG